MYNNLQTIDRVDEKGLLREVTFYKSEQNSNAPSHGYSYIYGRKLFKNDLEQIMGFDNHLKGICQFQDQFYSGEISQQVLDGYIDGYIEIHNLTEQEFQTRVHNYKLENPDYMVGQVAFCRKDIRDILTEF